MSVINLGLDFGSFGGRVAFLSDGHLTVPTLPSYWSDPFSWISCRLQSNSLLGIEYSTLKSRLGDKSATQDKASDENEAILHERLLDLRRVTSVETGRHAVQLVVSVPAQYPSFRREALCNAAAQAGFTDTRLLNDSMAAAISYSHPQSNKATILVYGMGYSGVEIALVRVDAKHFRAISYRGADSPGGAKFDDAILIGILRALEEVGLWSRLENHSLENWKHLWRWIQQYKESIFAEDAIVSPLTLPAASWKTIAIHVSRANVEQSLLPAFTGTLDLVDEVLADASLSPTDVDAILLTGGCTRIPMIPRMLAQRFGHQPLSLDDTMVARGAAIFSTRSHTGAESLIQKSTKAATSVDTPPAIRVLGPSRPTASGPDSDPTSPASRISVVPPQSSFLDEGQAHRRAFLAFIRELVKQGKLEQAADWVRLMTREARELLAAATPQSEQPTSRIDTAMRASFELLEQGRYQQAVESSHGAFDSNSNKPEIFQQMIDIHCQAAISLGSVEGYKKAMEWLMCAYEFDRTNRMIHKQIAERHFMHAQQTSGQADPSTALKALDKCLRFNPDHEGAIQLRGELSAAT
jgi:molecular chaperone DnaK (HSP70)